MKQILIILVLSLVTIGYSQNKNTKTSIEVNGVCGMCKARIEKAAIKTKGVKSAIWNIESHELKLIFDARKTNIDSIAKNIAGAGHDTKKYIATEDAYNSVAPCCKYRDEEVVKNHQ